MQIKSRGYDRWLRSPFIKGFIVAVVLCVVFVAGLQIGNGSWSVSFTNKPIDANKNIPNNLSYDSVERVYDDLRTKYDGELDVDALLLGMRKGLVEAAGDRYTTYLDSEEASAFSDDLNGTFSGIGAELAKENNTIIIVTPLAGSPAEAAGLRPQDIIVEIDSQDATGISVEEAVKRIRGEKGTTVKLGILRGTKSQEFTITRDTITIPSVKTSYEQNNTIGILEIYRFSDDTVKLVNDAVKEFKDKNVKGIVLDVRNNPGGYLDGAVSVSSHWLGYGQKVLDERRDGKTIQTFTAKANGALQGIPTVILINQGSASASEITAGALKDNNVATLVGVTSFGKGSVQEFSRYTNGETLKVTVARWFTPNGNNIDESGIEPDIKVELSEEDVANKNDPQKQKALQVLQNKMNESR